MRRRGVSLAELLLAVGLGLLVTGMLYQLFFPAWWLYQRQGEMAEAHQLAVVALDRVSLGLQETLPETVSVPPSGRAVGWRPLEEAAPFTAVGRPALKNLYVVYHWQDGSLFSCELAPVGVDWAQVLPLPSQHFLSLAPAGRRVAHFVTEFQVSPQGQFPLQIELAVSPPPRRQQHRQLTSRFSIRVLPRVSSVLPPS